MKLTQCNWFLGSLAAAALAVSATAAAQPTEHTADKPLPAASQLNLSDAQKSKIHAIRTQYREAAAKERTENGAREEWLKLRKELLQSPRFDENKVNRLIQLESQAHQKTALNQLREDFEIFQVLTPQQREQWLNRFESRRDKPGNHHHEPRHAQPQPAETPAK